MNDTPSRPRDEQSLSGLIETVLNGLASDSQFAELEQRLQTDPVARDLYATYMNLHCELAERFAVEGDIVWLEAELERELRNRELAGFRQEMAASSLGRSPRCSPLRRTFATALVAAVLLIGCFAWEFAHRSPGDLLPAIRDVEGNVTLIGASESGPARAGDALRPGERLRTDEQDARAVLEYPDGTVVELNVNSAIQVPAAGDVSLRLLAGSVGVNAARRPADRPLVLATDHAKYIVLGTRFRLYRNEQATRLELNEGKVRLQRQAAGRPVETVEVEPGSVATASSAAVPVEVRLLATGRARLKATLTATGHELALSPAGDLLAMSDNWRGLKTCPTEDFTVQDQYARNAGASAAVAFAPDGQTVVQLTKSGYVLLWRPGESQARKLTATGPNVRSRALSPDGSRVALSSEEGIEVSSIDFEAGEMRPLVMLPNRNGTDGKAWCLGFSRDGSRLAAGFWDGTVRLYDVGSTEIIAEWRLKHTPTVTVLSEDGQQLAAYTRKDGLLLIDTASGEQRTLWSSGGADVFRATFAEDARWLIAGCSDRTARVWSVADRSPLLVIDAEHSPRGLAWIAARRQLVTADGSVKVWECEIDNDG